MHGKKDFFCEYRYNPVNGLCDTFQSDIDYIKKNYPGCNIRTYSPALELTDKLSGMKIYLCCKKSGNDAMYVVEN